MQTPNRFVLLLMLMATPCVALLEPSTPNTVGQVLSLGGAVVQGSELSELLIGHTWKSIYRTDGQLTFREDHTFVGNVTIPNDRSTTGATGVFGEWSVNGAGQLCITWKQIVDEAPFCRSWYRLGERFFAGGPPMRAGWAVWPQVRVR